jgi:hypothetical protein
MTMLLEPMERQEATRLFMDDVLGCVESGPLERVTYQKGKGFKKCVGKYPGDDGALRPKIFWLGHQRPFAERCATMLVRIYDMLQQSGHPHWTAETLRDANDFLTSLRNVRAFAIEQRQQRAESIRSHLAKEGVSTPERTAPFPVAHDVQPGPPTAALLTLGTAVARYTGNLKLKVPTQLSQSNYDRQVSSLKVLYEAIPAATPIAQLNKMLLEGAVLSVTSRPVREKTGKPMAVDTVITTVKHWRQFFDWLDGDEWEAPRRMDKIFRIRRNVLFTPLEQKALADGKPVFTMEELRILYAAANDRQRLYLLSGLNFAFAQKDLATLLITDVNFEQRVIDRIRHKTRGIGIRGRWEMWPETVKAYKRCFAPSDETANPNGLAFLTEDGKALVNDDADSDAVAQSWTRLVGRMNKEKQIVRPLSFKTLRKTASDAILRISGSEEVQHLMLCDSPRSIGAKHYRGKADFSRLFSALRAFREELVVEKVFTGTAPTPAR